MMRHYLDIKDENQGRIVFYRVGDFYEMFFDDALLASKELDLTLTGKECGLEERAPMCGVPHHSADAYVKRLIEKGYKVAICEQTEDAALAKGLVRREVVRVVTPGTVIEDSMLSDDRNNYIAAICYTGQRAGLCFADVSTGAVQATVVGPEELEKAVCAQLARYAPSEVLFAADTLKLARVTDFIKRQLHCSVELVDDEEFAPALARQRVEEVFGEQAGEWFSPSGESPELWALGGLIGYLSATQSQGARRLKSYMRFLPEEYMNLSPTSRANLELTETMRAREKRGSLLWVLDKTQSAMGRRLLRRWLEQPLVRAADANHRLDAVDELFKGNVARLEIAEALAGVADLERLMTRVVYGSASPREVGAMAATFAALPAVKALAAGFASPQMAEIEADIDTLEDVAAAIGEALCDEPPATQKDGGFIRAGYSAEVDDLRSIVSNSKEILAKIERDLREETGIRTLRIKFNKVFGYFIEVSKSFVDQVPESFIRKQTLTGGERYITEELKALENKILGAGERLNTLERSLFEELQQFIRARDVRIQRTAEALAKLDVLCALAQAAVANGYVRPLVDEGDGVLITQGRHPVVEQMQRDAPFVPNDTKLDGADNRMQIITGPNMAGKSTYMRQVALIVVMAQIGSFVPAESAKIGMCDAVFTRVGASDDLAGGRSTFMVEMTEVAEILKLATPKSLVILDEIGRGTSTFDGMSIAQGVVEYITDRDIGPGCKTLFATHYHELTDLENSLDGVKNYNILVKKRGDDITFLRRIVRGPADDSYGIEVAKLAGVPAEVLTRARQVLKALEKSSADLNRVTQLDFETFEEMQGQQLPAELVEALRATDPETLTPLEALQLVYELKKTLG